MQIISPVSQLTDNLQQAHTKANVEIALHTKRDGSQMKSIAFLTMIYLPSTYAAVSRNEIVFIWRILPS